MKYYVGLFLCVVSIFSAQTADEIINKNLEITGGVENWKQLNSIQINAKTVLSLTQEYPVQIYQQTPNLTKTVFTMEQKKIVTELYDGKNAYSFDFVTHKLLKNATFQPESFDSDFIDFQKKGLKATKLDNAKFKNTECFRVELSKNKEKTLYWFDVKTYQLLREDKEKESLYYSDFKKVQKWVFPFRIQSLSPQGKEDYTLFIYQILPNLKLDSRVFKP